MVLVNQLAVPLRLWCWGRTFLEFLAYSFVASKDCNTLQMLDFALLEFWESWNIIKVDQKRQQYGEHLTHLPLKGCRRNCKSDGEHRVFIPPLMCNRDSCYQIKDQVSVTAMKILLDPIRTLSPVSDVICQAFEAAFIMSMCPVVQLVCCLMTCR